MLRPGDKQFFNADTNETATIKELYSTRSSTLHVVLEDGAEVIFVGHPMTLYPEPPPIKIAEEDDATVIPDVQKQRRKNTNQNP